MLDRRFPTGPSASIVDGGGDAAARVAMILTAVLGLALFAAPLLNPAL